MSDDDDDSSMEYEEEEEYEVKVDPIDNKMCIAEA